MEALFAQLENVRNAIASEVEDDAIKKLQEEERSILAKIEEAKAQETIQATANELVSNLEVFRVGGEHYALSELAAGGDELVILRAGIAQIGKEQAQKWLEDLNRQKETYEKKIAQLEDEIGCNAVTIDGLQTVNGQLKLENEDLAEKRDAAVRAAEEAQSESASKDARIAELERKLAEAPTASGVVEIESEEQLKLAAQRLKEKQAAAEAAKRAAEEAARIRVYGAYKLDLAGANYGAYRVDNDEYVTYGWLDKKYIALSDEEARQFREEIEAQKEQSTALVESAAPVEPPQVPDLSQFPEPDAEVPANVLDGEVAQDAVRQAETWEQWVENAILELQSRIGVFERERGYGSILGEPPSREAA